MCEESKRRQVFGAHQSGNAHHSPKRHMLRLFVTLIVAFTATTAPMIVFAQGGYPQPVDPYVNDYAKLLTTEDAATIRTLFANLKRDTGIEAVVVTINTVSDYSTGDQTIESFATNLFNSWGIGDSEQNNGVLILVAVADRDVRIELGSGYESAFNAKMQEVIDEHMLPSFRRDEYSWGIYRGARAVIGELTGVWPPEANSVNSPVSSEDGVPGWLLAVLLGGVFVVSAIFVIGLGLALGWGSGIPFLSHSSSDDSFDYSRDIGDSSRLSDSDHSSRSDGSFGSGESSGEGASGKW